MKKHKTKFIAAFVIFAMLAGAWFLGGMPEINHPTPEGAAEVAAHEQLAEAATSIMATQADAVPGIVGADEMDEADTADEVSEPEYIFSEDEGKDEEAAPYDLAIELGEQDEQNEGFQNFDIIPETANPDRFAATPEGIILPEINPEKIQIFAADHPEMRAPVEPEDMTIGDGSFTVTLSVRAHTILYNMHLLHRDKHELVPEDGWIFPPEEVVVYEGESVFNVLQREMRRHRIHMVARWTPIFNSAYVEAINNLYEFDVGPLSGWMYSVNGWFPNFGASRYLLSPGDVIEWVYTVDLGRDLGVMWLGG